MNHFDFLQQVHHEHKSLRQFHDVIKHLYETILREGSDSIIHNLRNTSGTETEGIDDTITRLKNEGFFVERVQERYLDMPGQLKMHMQTTIRVGLKQLQPLKFAGSITDPLIDEPLPKHLTAGISR